MDPNAQSDRLVGALSELGLTRTEAEVYLTCLDLAADGPLSSYRAAQAMGRDPANVGKIISALAKVRAVRVVQDKPRLIVPVPPAEFIDGILARMQDRREEAVAMLEKFRSPPPVAGTVMPLAHPAEALERASQLLDDCRRQALVFGSGDALRQLGHALENAADHPGRRVRVLSPVAFASEAVDIVTIPTSFSLGSETGADWLQLVVDDSAWLCAHLSADPGGNRPCGWWCTGTATARAMRLSLDLAYQAADLREFALEPVEPALMDSPEPAAEIGATTEPAPEPAAATEATERGPLRAAAAPDDDLTARPRTGQEAAATPTANEGTAAADSEEFEEGITFVFRRPRERRDGDGGMT